MKQLVIDAMTNLNDTSENYLMESSNIFEETKPVVSSNPNDSNYLKILQFSDLHLDLLYQEVMNITYVVINF